MIDVNDLRKGVTFQSDGNLYRVMEYAHNKPGRGTATIRIKARDIRKGNTLEMTFISGDRVQDVRLDYHNVQYLYRDENMEVKLTFFGEEPLDIELPTSVDLKVISAEASARGNTATGVTKLVVTDTGLKVQTPGFVNEGDTIRVDTRTGEYLTRV